MKHLQLGTIARVLLGCILPATACAALAQRSFDSPEAAAKALIAATSADDEAALVEIFGAQHRALIGTADKAQDRETRTRFAKAAAQYLLLRPDREGHVTIVVGTDAWPVPIPLVRSGAAWSFDAAAGAEELVNRRIGANEIAAIGVLSAYSEAQHLYASKLRSETNVRQFAQKLRSTPGKMDGLYWEADPAKGEEPSPFGPLLKDAAGHERGDPYHGYYYRVLKGQGPAAPGGRYSYVINGRMVAGYALIAWPAQYGISGVKTFIVNHYGEIHEKDLGPKGGQLAAAIKEYNPDKSWLRLAD